MYIGKLILRWLMIHSVFILVYAIMRAPLTTPCAPAEPWCTTQTRSRRTRMATAHHTGARPGPCGRRSRRNRRFHREASSGPPLTSQTTSWARRGGGTCRPCRGSRRMVCIWNPGCDPVRYLRNEREVMEPLDLVFNSGLKMRWKIWSHSPLDLLDNEIFV